MMMVPDVKFVLLPPGTELILTLSTLTFLPVDFSFSSLFHFLFPTVLLARGSADKSRTGNSPLFCLLGFLDPLFILRN